MARAFLKVYFDFAERTKELNDNEKGRLLMAMLDYARTGELPDLKGNERFCFSMFKVDIDRDCANYAAKVRNGSKGGRPAQSQKPKKSENNLTKANETEKNLNKPKREEKEEEKEEEDEKEKDIISCTEQSPVPVISLPLNDGTEYLIFENQCSEWQELFPAVDIKQQLREMRAWLIANKNRRKTSRGILRFISSWLSKEQDQYRPQRNTAGKKSWSEVAAEMEGTV